MYPSECSQKVAKCIEVENPSAHQFFITYTCDICDYVCGRKKELDKHMQEKHDFKYPWKVLSQVSLRLRDWSPRILKASGIKFQNNQVISIDDEELSILRTEHQPRMLENLKIDRTPTKKSTTGADEKSATLKGCLVKGGLEKDKKKRKDVTFKEEGSLCEVTYFRQNIDDPFRGNLCKECDFTCASREVLEWHMKSTHNEVQQCQNNLNEDLWETKQLIISVIVAVCFTLCTCYLLPAIE